MPTASQRTKPLGLFQGKPAPRLYEDLIEVLRVRHCFATHLLADGYEIRTVQELPGRKDVRTTMIYTHVLNRGGRGVRSPADVLAQERPQPGARPKQPNAPQDGR